MLLELESRLLFDQQELAELVSGAAFPRMPVDSRVTEVADLTAQVAASSDRVRILRSSLGDPESVVDENGRLPADRRELSLLQFSLWRHTEVRKSRDQLSELRGQLRRAEARSPQRKAVEQEISASQRRLEQLLDVPLQVAADMCSERAHPRSWHRWSVRGGDLTEIGPCPAFPLWAAKLQQIRDEFFSKPATPPAPSKEKPQPLAVIPSGLSIAEVIKRSSEAQARWPDAQARRGSRNRWELWLPK